MMRNISEILAHALELFEGGSRWNNQRWAQEVGTERESFCALGAIHKSMARHKEVDVPFHTTSGYLRTQLFTHNINFGCVVDHLEKYASIRRYPDKPRLNVAAYNDQQTAFEPIKQWFCAAIKGAIAEEEKHT